METNHDDLDIDSFNLDVFKKMKIKPGKKCFFCGRLLNSVITRDINFLGGYEIVTDISESDVIIAAFSTFSEFDKTFKDLSGIAKGRRDIWVSYPKGTGKTSGLNRDIIWDNVLVYGYHPVSLISINESWSSIRLVVNNPGLVYERPGKN